MYEICDCIRSKLRPEKNKAASAGAGGHGGRAPRLAPRSIFPRGKRGPGVFRRGFSCKVTVRPIGPKFGHRRVGGDIREGTGEVAAAPAAGGGDGQVASHQKDR